MIGGGVQMKLYPHKKGGGCDHHLGCWDKTWHMGEKNSKIGNANIDNFLRYYTEEF